MRLAVEHNTAELISPSVCVCMCFQLVGAALAVLD